VIYGSDQNHQLLPSSGSVKRKVYSFAAWYPIKSVLLSPQEACPCLWYIPFI
jgi:hypothetical protein